MAEEITIDMRDGRSVTFDEIVVLERDNGEWLRFVRNEPSPREKFPQTTKYYHLADDVERIVIEPRDESGDASSKRAALSAATVEAALLSDGCDGDRSRSRVKRRILE